MRRLLAPSALILSLAAGGPAGGGQGRALAGDEAPSATSAHPLSRAEELLATIAPKVEQACGAKFPSPPRVVELTTDEAAAAFADDLRPEFERRYATVPERSRQTLLRLAATTSVRSSLARYSFTRDEIVVVREGFDAQCAALRADGERAARLLTVTLAHECVHALDDARFDLRKLYGAARDDEAVRAVAMVAEGRAVHFGRSVSAALGMPKDLVDLLPGGASPGSEREWHLHLTYRLGARFTAALVERGGVALADKALAAPPATTWPVCVPARWPDAAPDERPARILGRAGLASAARPLSHLQLLERYASMKGLDAAETLFAKLTGGAQALAEDANSAVLSFADEESATRYEEISKTEAPTSRAGTVVVRAIGASQEERLAALVAALPEPEPTKR